MSATSLYQKYLSRLNILNKYGDHYYSLFSTCIPTKGKSRSIIADLQRHTFEFVPNELVDILDYFKGRKIKDIYRSIDSKEHKILESYFKLLIEKEYILLTTKRAELKKFPPLDLTWESPSYITNSIVDIGNIEYSYQLYFDFLKQTSDLGCLYIQFRFYGPDNLPFAYEKLFQLISNLSFISFEIICTSPTIRTEIDKIFNLLLKYPKLSNIVLHSVPESIMTIAPVLPESYKGKVALTMDKIKDHSSCGNISPYFFRINEEMYTESIAFNNCLNKKISVDKDGYIKNCPSMDFSYGHIAENPNLKNILEKAGFKKFWKVNKDKIEGCRDCEFRYICSDCRVWVSSPLSKPITCNYNPETCTWE